MNEGRAARLAAICLFVMRSPIWAGAFAHRAGDWLLFSFSLDCGKKSLYLPNASAAKLSTKQREWLAAIMKFGYEPRLAGMNQTVYDPKLRSDVWMEYQEEAVLDTGVRALAADPAFRAWAPEGVRRDLESILSEREPLLALSNAEAAAQIALPDSALNRHRSRLLAVRAKWLKAFKVQAELDAGGCD